MAILKSPKTCCVLAVALFAVVRPVAAQTTTGATTGTTTATTTATTTGATTATTTTTTAGTIPADYTSKLTNPVNHTVANQYLSVTEEESGTQEVSYRTGGNVEVDLKGKWSIISSGGDPLTPASSGQDITLFAHDIFTGAIGGDSNYMIAYIDGATSAVNGQIPGQGVQYSHDGGLGGGNTTGTTGTAATTTNTTGTTSTTTTAGTVSTTTTTGTTTATTTTGTVKVTPHAIEFGTGGFGLLSASGTQTLAHNNQFPIEHTNSRTITSVWIDPTSNVGFICFLTLLRDAVRVQYSAFNQDTRAHTVGMRLQFTPNTNNETFAVNGTPAGANPHGWIYLPGFGLQETEARYDKPNIPDQWFSYDALPNYVIGTRAIMNGQGATSPDHIIVGDGGQMQDCCSNDYIYQFDSGRSTRDPVSFGPGLAEYWDPQILLPGQTRTIVQYYGLTGAQEDFSLPFVLATEAPAALAYAQVNSAATGTGVQTTTVQYSPNPFPIKGFVYNASGFHQDTNPFNMLQQVDAVPLAISAASLTLTPGPGLALASFTPLSQSLGTVPNQTDGIATWQVTAGGIPAGTAQYLMAGGGDPLGSKTALNSVQIPATPGNFFMGGTLEMVTFPFQFAGMSLSQVLPQLATGQAVLARWNPTDQTYHIFSPNLPDAFLQQVTPGAAYWLGVTPSLAAGIPIALPANPTPLALLNSTAAGSGTSGLNSGSLAGFSTIGTAPIILHKGWNQVGNPFVYSTLYSEVQILYNGALYSIANAVRNGILPSTSLYSYDAALNRYDIINPTANTQLPPYEGFWVFSNFEGVAMVFTAQALPNAQIEAPIASSTGTGFITGR